MKQGPLGILAALPEEIAGLIERLEAPHSIETWGQRAFHRGRLHGRDCVIALSRIGKVAAASTATTLIAKFDVSAILFVGVAGGVGSDVQVGDVVIADVLMQHDMDASPLFPRFDIPLLGRARFETSAEWTDALQSAAQRYVKAHHRRKGGEGTSMQALPHRAPRQAGVTYEGVSLSAAASASLFSASRPPVVHRGLIASGDRFVSSRDEIAALLATTPELLAVDMESAAVGQVCHEHQIPVAILRSISDGANESAAMSFSQFLTDVAAQYADGILEALLSSGTAPATASSESAVGALPVTQAGATV